MTIRPRRQPSRPSPATGNANRGRAAPHFPEIRFRVDFDDRSSIGIGKVALLQAVERTGSLSQAARDMGMSYRRAWLLMDSMNGQFDTAVISATVGGSGGGGATLTPFGRELIEAYRKLQTRLIPLATEYFGKFAARAAGHRYPGAAGRIPPRRPLSRPLNRGTARHPQKA